MVRVIVSIFAVVIFTSSYAFVAENQFIRHKNKQMCESLLREILNEWTWFSTEEQELKDNYNNETYDNDRGELQKRFYNEVERPRRLFESMCK